MTYKIIGDMREQKIINEETKQSYYFEEIVDVLNDQQKEIESLKFQNKRLKMMME